MSERAPYSRVYWSVVDDPKFAAIYDNNDHLSTWLRLLILADQAHPASGNVPIGTRRASLSALVDVGLIDLGTGNRYRIHGLDAERERRKAAATTRTGPKRGPDGTPTVPERVWHTRPKTRRDETRQAEPDARDPWDDPEAEAVAWLARHGCALQPHSGYYRHLVLMVESHGINAVIGMFDRLASAGTKDGDVKGFVFVTRDELDKRTRPDLREVAKSERDAEADQTRKRERERTQKYLADLRAIGGDA